MEGVYEGAVNLLPVRKRGVKSAWTSRSTSYICVQSYLPNIIFKRVGASRPSRQRGLRVLYKGITNSLTSIEISSKSTVTVAGRATRNFDRNLPLTEREFSIKIYRDTKRKIRLPLVTTGGGTNEPAGPTVMGRSQTL